MSDDAKQHIEAVQMLRNRLICASTRTFQTQEERKLRELCGAAAEMLRKVERAFLDAERDEERIRKRKDDYKRLRNE